MNLHDNDGHPIHDSEDVQRYFADLKERVDASDVFLLLLPSDEGIDLKVSVELGLATLLDKDVWVLAPTGRVVPENLIKYAAQVIPMIGDPMADSTEIATRLAERR